MNTFRITIGTPTLSIKTLNTRFENNGVKSRQIFYLFILLMISFSESYCQSKSTGALNCTANLTIKKFRIANNATGSALPLDYKVVVGREIDYKVKGNNGSNWNWELGSGTCSNFTNYWNLNATGSPAVFKMKSNGNNKAIIPLSQLPTSNSDFGPKHGSVKVSNNVEASCNIDPVGTKVEVFFEKDAPNQHKPTEPNWYYYWSQILSPADLQIPGIKLYNWNNKAFDTIPTPYAITLMYDPPPYAPGQAATIGKTDSQAWDFESYAELPNGPIIDKAVIGYKSDMGKTEFKSGCGQSGIEFVSNTALYGIDMFYTTFIHEKEHHLIKCDFWANGQYLQLDNDRDGYPDVWETTDPDAQNIYMFTIHMTNLGMDKYVSGYVPSLQGIQVSAETSYEEVRCRQEQIKHIGKHYNKDWSFDPTHTVQGKQWK